MSNKSKFLKLEEPELLQITYHRLHITTLAG